MTEGGLCSTMLMERLGEQHCLVMMVVIQEVTRAVVLAALATAHGAAASSAYLVHEDYLHRRCLQG